MSHVNTLFLAHPDLGMYAAVGKGEGYICMHAQINRHRHKHTYTSIKVNTNCVRR